MQKRESYLYVGMDLHKKTHTAVLVNCWNEKIGSMDAASEALKGFLRGADKANTIGKDVVGNGNLGSALENAVKNADESSDAIASADKAIGTAAEGAGETLTKPYATSRPKYGKTQVDDVWNNYKDPTTDQASDPAGGSISWDKTKPRQGQWDMGHIPGEKYSDMRDRYIKGEISQKEFLEWYRNPANYRPELPSTNRSYKYE